MGLRSYSIYENYVENRCCCSEQRTVVDDQRGYFTNRLEQKGYLRKDNRQDQQRGVERQDSRSYNFQACIGGILFRKAFSSICSERSLRVYNSKNQKRRIQ
jgi:hypothetical protein